MDFQNGLDKLLESRFAWLLVALLSFGIVALDFTGVASFASLTFADLRPVPMLVFFASFGIAQIAFSVIWSISYFLFGRPLLWLHGIVSPFDEKREKDLWEIGVYDHQLRNYLFQIDNQALNLKLQNYKENVFNRAWSNILLHQTGWYLLFLAVNKSDALTSQNVPHWIVCIIGAIAVLLPILMAVTRNQRIHVGKEWAVEIRRVLDEQNAKYREEMNRRAEEERRQKKLYEDLEAL